MLQKIREVWSQTDYILGTDCCLFRNVTVHYPRHNSDHYMVLGCLPSASLTEHKSYLGGRNNITLRPPIEPTGEDDTFAVLQRAVPKPRVIEARRNEWISTETWRLVNERVSARRDPAKGQAIKIRLGRDIKASLAVYRRRRADEAGADVEALVGVDPPLIQEAWPRIQGWYKDVLDCAPPPARFMLERITAERVALYSYVPPPGGNIPVNTQPFLVDYSVPEEGEIEWAFKRLRNNRSGGPSRIRAEHVK